MNRMTHALASLAGVVGLVAIATSAFASDFTTREVEATGKAEAKGNIPGYKDAALSELELEFLNGDHKLRRIGVVQSGTRVTGRMSDKNGGDPVRMRATYMKLPLAQVKVAEAVCTQVCTIPIANRPKSGDQLALVGFDLELHNTDRNVQVIAVEPTSDEKSYRVEFRDKSGTKFRARVQYAWFRPDKSGKKKVSATRPKGKKDAAMTTGPLSSAPHVLQGFRAEYLDGDHHIKQLSIRRKSNRYEVRFNDNNYDDPVRVTLSLVWAR